MVKLKLENLKEIKKNAVKKQKNYLKVSEIYMQKYFGEENYSNFIFKKKKEEEEESIGMKSWRFIQGWGISNKSLK